MCARELSPSGQHWSWPDFDLGGARHCSWCSCGPEGSLHTLPPLCGGGHSLPRGAFSIRSSSLNLGQSCARGVRCSFPGSPARPEAARFCLYI